MAKPTTTVLRLSGPLPASAEIPRCRLDAYRLSRKGNCVAILGPIFVRGTCCERDHGWRVAGRGYAETAAQSDVARRFARVVKTRRWGRRRHADALCSDSCIASGICKSRRTQAIAQTRQLTGDVIAGTKRRSTKDMTASCSSRASSVAIDDTRPSLWSQSKLSRQPTRAHAFATYARWRSAKHCSTLSLASRPLLLVVSASSGPPPSHAYVPARTGSRAIGTILTYAIHHATCF